jgi:hypothetical protein
MRNMKSIVEKIKFSIQKPGKNRKSNKRFTNNLVPSSEEIMYDYVDTGSNVLVAKKYGLTPKQIQKIVKENK